MQKITSTTNQTIKNLAKLNKKKYREQEGFYLIEGFHLVDEAFKSKLNFKYLLATQAAFEKLSIQYHLDLTDKRLIQINERVAKHLSATTNSQDVFMVLKINQPKHFTFNFGKWILLDSLADPGNIGTIIRTADAAGFNGVVLSENCADLYNPKTQRAMQGSQFHIPIIKADLLKTIEQFKENYIPVYASVLDDEAKELPDFEKTKELALIIGNEANGVSGDAVSLADEKLFIPIKGQAESLNAAIAAGIMIYHFA